MPKYIKAFSAHTDYESFMQTTDFTLPNISHCVQQKETHFNPKNGAKLIAIFNLTSGSNPSLYYYHEGTYLGSNMFSKIEIDGTEVSIESLDNNGGCYDLPHGRHVVEYTLKNPLRIGREFDTQTGEYTEINACFDNVLFQDVALPSSLVKIGEDAFNYCQYLENVSLPSGLKSICRYAFHNCHNLITVNIPSGIQTIEDMSFCGCYSLDDDSYNAISAINTNTRYCGDNVK